MGISIFLKYLILVIALIMGVVGGFFFSSPKNPILKVDECNEQHPWYLLHDGRIEEAKKGYQCLTAKARRGNSYDVFWSTLMEESWFYHQIGDNKPSIELSNEALRLAQKERRDADIGRSLSWLAWAYGNLGLYDVSEQLYRRAIEIGAPGGEIRYVHVWGMSTQELGYLLMRRGKLEEAGKLLHTTTDYAREHGIDVGVAEGGAHLAQLFYEEGRYREALASAEEAIEASYRCNCSPLNTARALTLKARVLTLLTLHKNEERSKAEKAIEDLITFSEGKGIKRFQAEAYLIKSDLLPSSDFDTRLSLLSRSLDILQKIESEERGTASVAVGELFLERDNKELAEQYLDAGAALQERMFRTIDESYAKAMLSNVALIKGELQKRFQTLQDTATLSEENGALPLALDSYQTLMHEFSAAKYVVLAIVSGENALRVVNTLLSQPNDAKVKETFLKRKLLILEEIAKNELLTKPSVQKGVPT